MAEAQTGTGAPGAGAVRAAAVLLGLGPEIASAVFRQLGEAEVRRVALGAKELRKGPPTAVADALRAFSEAMERVGGDAAASDDLLREMAAKALGHDVARRAFDGVVPPPPPDEVLGPIAQADPESLAMVLVREQVQTIALVLSSIDPDRAAAVLERLPEKKRPEIVRRMATIESVAPEVLREVGQALTAELRAVIAGGMRHVDGKSAALEILRRSSAGQQAEVLAEIEKEDQALAADLRGQLFTFDDLAGLSNKDVQTLIKELDLNRLTLALRGASGPIKDIFLRNMSTRSAQMLQDDLAAMGPVRAAVVEKARAEITRTALQLAEQERITIVRPTDKML